MATRSTRARDAAAQGSSRGAAGCSAPTRSLMKASSTVGKSGTGWAAGPRLRRVLISAMVLIVHSFVRVALVRAWSFPVAALRRRATA